MRYAFLSTCMTIDTEGISNIFLYKSISYIFGSCKEPCENVAGSYDTYAYDSSILFSRSLAHRFPAFFCSHVNYELKYRFNSFFRWILSNKNQIKRQHSSCAYAEYF